MAPKQLDFITGNTNKLNEVREILSSVPNVELRSQNVDLPEIQGAIEEISRHKCSTAADIVRVLNASTRTVCDGGVIAKWRV